MPPHPAIDEFDLLSYADGRLDEDPFRKADVERRLRDDPEAAARAREYRSQAAALRRSYGPIGAEPVPARLRTVLQRRRTLLLERIAAVLTVAVAAGALGWHAGGAGSDDRPMRALLDSVQREFPIVLSTPGLRVADGGVVSDAGAPAAPGLRAPDLTALGWRLLGSRTGATGEGGTMQFIYATAEGRRVALFLRTPPPGPETDVALHEADGLTIALWQNTPPAAALATPFTEAETARLAQQVRQAFGSPGEVRAAQ